MSTPSPHWEHTHLHFTCVPALSRCWYFVNAVRMVGSPCNVLLDNDNVENIAQERVRLLFVLYHSLFPIRPSSPSLASFPHHFDVRGDRQQW